MVIDRDAPVFVFPAMIYSAIALSESGHVGCRNYCLVTWNGNVPGVCSPSSTVIER